MAKVLLLKFACGNKLLRLLLLMLATANVLLLLFFLSLSHFKSFCRQLKKVISHVCFCKRVLESS